MSNPGKKVKISAFTLAMINVAAIVSLRSLPGFADDGYTLIFYLVIASLCFFIPSALVAAELASGWPKPGGVYHWVEEAFGPKWGFLAVFMQWVQNLPWFPALLAFSASCIAYIFNPALAENKIFVIGVIWISLWSATFLNFKGMRLSAFLSSSGAVCGTIFPAAIIIVLGVLYFISGRPMAVEFSFEALVPDFRNLNQLMILAGMIMAISGMEMSAVHVNEVENPRKNYPRAIFISALISISISIFGALAIAIAIPRNKLSLSAGVCQAFEELLGFIGASWALPLISLLLAYGALAMVITWMLGPSKGLLEVAKKGYFPDFWKRCNKEGIPTGILIIQSVFASFISLVIFVMPNISSAFWIMNTLAIQLYIIMYLLKFAAAIRLRYSHPEVERPYKIPGGKTGMWIVSGVAILSLLCVTIFGFIPTESVRQAGTGKIIQYIAFLFFGMVTFLTIPFILHKRLTKKQHNN